MILHAEGTGLGPVRRHFGVSLDALRHRIARVNRNHAVSASCWLPIIAAIASLKSILFDNGFVLCRPTAYSPEVAALAPECKPPNRPVAQYIS